MVHLLWQLKQTKIYDKIPRKKEKIELLFSLRGEIFPEDQNWITWPSVDQSLAKENRITSLA